MFILPISTEQYNTYAKCWRWAAPQVISLCGDVCVVAVCKRDASIGIHGKEGPVLHQKRGQEIMHMGIHDVSG